MAQLRVPYFFHRVGESENLPLYSCRTLREDKLGSIWMGTHNGIVRFDGVHSTVFEGFTSKDSVHYKFLVNACETDPAGNLWFGHTTGMTKINPVDLSMAQFPFPAHSIAINQKREFLFVNYKGLCRLEKNGAETVVDRLQGISTKDFSPALAHRVYCLEAFPNHFWVTSQGKMCRVRFGATRKLVADNPEWLAHFPASESATWYKKDKNSFWVLNADSRVLLAVDARNGKGQKSLALLPAMRADELEPMLEDGSGNIWVSQSGSKVWLYLAKSQSFVQLNHGTKVGEFQSTSVRSALLGKNNMVWLGTDNGLQAVQPDQNWLNIHHMFNPEDSASKKDRILDFAYFKGEIWLTCAFGKLMKYNPTTGAKEWFSSPGLIPGQAKEALPQAFYSIIPFGEELMIGTRKGLVFFDPRQKKFYTKAQFQQPHWQYLISIILPEKEQFVWAWAHDKRWIRIRKSDLKEDSVPQFLPAKGRKYWISKPLQGPNKELAFELPQGYGVALPSVENGRPDSIVWVKNPPWTEGTFSINSTWNGQNLICRNLFPTSSILVDLQRKQYLKPVSASNRDYELFKTSHFDKLGNLWLADQNAIGWLDPKTKRYFTYHFKFGTGEFLYDLRFINGEGNKLFLKSMYEIAEIDPNRFGKHLKGLNPCFSAIRLNGEMVGYDSAQMARLSPVQNNISLDFGFLCSDLSAYTLEYSINHEPWKTVGKGYRLDLISLDPGKYQIGLRAVSKDGFFKSQTASMQFQILPPFYKTFWFLGLVVLGLGGLLIAYLRSKWQARDEVFALETRALNLEKEKTIVQYESLKQQLNPHFLFNSLTSLGSLIRIDPKMAASFLEAMSKSYRYILKSQDQELVPVTDELAFIQTFIKLQKVRFEDALEVNLDIPEEAFHLKIVPVTLQNLIENAIKHNIVDIDSPLKISIFVKEGYLVVENNLQKKEFVETSNKKGLANLISLYKYLDSRPVKIEETESFFRISIPLV